MDYNDNKLRQQLFYDTPPRSPDHRFYTEILSKGRLDWLQFARGATCRGSNHLKYQEITFPEFTLIGCRWRMVARVSWYTKWGSRVGDLVLQVYISPQSGKMPENFRITLGVSLWAGQSLTKYKLLDRVASKVGHVYGFDEFKVLDSNRLPGPEFVQGFSSNLTAYVRLEVGNSRIYPLVDSNPMGLDPSDRVEHTLQMTMYNHEYQDSTLFEFAGAQWRLFYCVKPKTKLLLQRMPDTQAGTIGVDFDLFGVKDGVVIVQDYLDHEFNEGFNDWGVEDNIYQKCSALGVRIRYFDGKAYGNEPVGQPNEEMLSTEATNEYLPPPGPPPGSMPPGGPPPVERGSAGYNSKEEPPSYQLQG